MDQLAKVKPLKSSNSHQAPVAIDMLKVRKVLRADHQSNVGFILLT